MEHVKRAPDIAIANLQIGFENAQNLKQTFPIMDLDTCHLYPEIPVDGELVSFPYISVAGAETDLERLGPIADLIGESLFHV